MLPQSREQLASPTASTRLDGDVPGDESGATSLIGLSGTVLDGRYELGEILGEGGMGAVFDARDPVLDRRVAIKVIRAGYAERDDYVRRFLREAKAASKVRHRNVVMSLDYGEAEGGLVYSVMELLRGQDLKQLLEGRPGGRLSWREACGLLIQTASGLKAAHDQGVIHRDIKPANCFVTEEDEQPMVKLVDFGIAKLDDGPEGEQITRTSQVLGTPSYIAPELVRTLEAAGPRSDVYSMGVMAYRMIAGSLPFLGETAFEVMHRACTEPVPKLRRQVPELPAGVEKLVLQMLAKAPEERPADMGEVRERLLALLGEPSRRGVAWWLPMVGAVSVAVGVGLVWSALGGSDDGEAVVAGSGPVVAGSGSVVGEEVSDRSSGGSGEPADEEWRSLLMRSSPLEFSAPPAEVSAELAAPKVDPVEELAESRGSTQEPGASPEPEATASEELRRSRARNKPKGRSSDKALEKKLRRKIKHECGELMAGKPVKVLFNVTEGGKVEGLTATSKNAAGECAKRQVQGIRFQPRAKEKFFSVAVG